MIIEALLGMIMFSVSTVLLKKISKVPMEKMITPPNVYFLLGMVVTALTGFIFSYLAMKNGKSAIVSAVVSCAPLGVMILSTIFLGESYSLKEIVGVVIIIIGLVVLTI